MAADAESQAIAAQAFGGSEVTEGVAPQLYGPSAWPYRPRRGELARMFTHPLADRLNRVNASVPALLFGPVVIAAVLMSPGAPGIVLARLLAGILAWTLFEYLLHRFLFHIWPHDPRTHQRVYVVHGVHHVYPDDPHCVVHPVATVTIAVVLAPLLYFSFGPEAAPPLFAGFALGYILYDSQHYLAHHRKPRTRLFRLLKRHHLKHHFQDPSARFGVSTPLWDWVFRSW